MPQHRDNRGNAHGIRLGNRARCRLRGRMSVAVFAPAFKPGVEHVDRRKQDTVYEQAQRRPLDQLRPEPFCKDDLDEPAHRCRHCPRCE